MNAKLVSIFTWALLATACSGPSATRGVHVTSPADEATSWAGADVHFFSALERISQHRADVATDGEYLQRFVDANPNDVDGLAVLADHLQATGREKEAHELCVRLLALGRTAPALECAARCTTDWSEKKALASEALAIDPNLSDANNELGRALLGLGDPIGARAAFKRFSELRPLSEVGYKNAAIAAAAAGSYDDAAYMAGAAAGVSVRVCTGGDPGVWALLARLYEGDALWPQATPQYAELARAAAGNGPVPSFDWLPPGPRTESLRPPPALDGSPCIGLVFDRTNEPNRVFWVQGQSSARAAGVVPGDVLVAIQGSTNFDREKIEQSIVAVRPGEVVSFKVLRSGKSLTLETICVSDKAVFAAYVEGLTLAQSAAKRGDWNAVRRSTQVAQEIAFASPMALALQALAGEALNDHDAVTFCKSLLAPFPRESDLWQVVLETAAARASPDEIESLLASAGRIDAPRGLLTSMRGLAAARRQDSVSARRDFERALALGRGGRAIVALGRSLDELEAREASQRAEAQEQGQARDLLLLQMLLGSFSGSRGGGSDPWSSNEQYGHVYGSESAAIQTRVGIY